MEEIWKDIEGYEGLYQVSNLGRVKRIMFINNRTSKTINKILSNGKLDKNQYIQLKLSKDNNKKDIYLHRLVAQAFIPNPNHYSDINHIDGNKCNNRVDNLEWCTHKVNIQHAHKKGLVKVKYGKNNHASKEVIQYDLLMNEIGRYESTLDVERKLGYFHTGIADCCRGRIKTSHGYIWKYKED